MDTTGFFQYPGDAVPDRPPPGFLEDRGEEDWALLLDHTETRRSAPGQDVLTAGRDRPRALPAGRRPAGGPERRRRADQHVRRGGVPRRPPARGHGDRDDRRRGPAARPRAVPRALRAPPGPRPRRPARPGPRSSPPASTAPATTDRGVDGLMATITFPNYTQIPSKLSLRGLARDPRRQPGLRAGRRRAAGRGPRHRPVPDVEGDHPGAAAAVHGRPGRVAQHLPARDLQPDAAGARPDQGAEPAELAQGIRLRHRDQPVRRLRDPAQGRPRRQRPAVRAAAAGRDDRRLRRRHGPEGQERLVLDDVPAAARAAHLRPDAVRARRQQPLPAVRRLRQELLRLQPARGLPGRPQRQRRLLGRPPALLRRRLPGPRARLLRHRRQRRRSGMLLYMAVSLALFALATTFIKVSTHTITSTFGAIAFGIFYWYVAGQLEPATWPLRAAAIALAAVWLLRTWRKEKPFLAQAAAPIAGRRQRRRRPLDRQQPRGQVRRARGPLRPRGQDRRRQGGPVACWRSPSPTG